MKHHIVLFPLMGMEFDGMSLRFGDSRAAAEAVLGTADGTHAARSYYFDNQLAVDFDEAGAVRFVEFLGGAEGSLQPELYGVPVFQTEADELLELLAQHGEAVDEDGGYTVTIPSVSVGLYREITPADVDGMAREMSRIDVTTLGHVNLEAEYRRARHWDTIGIGAKDYYAF